MKLSEIKNEKAIEMLADLIEPCAAILADKEVLTLIKSKDKTNIVKTIMKKFSSQIVLILSVLDGVSIEKYECNLLSVPAKMLEIINDKELLSFFASQVQLTDGEYSGLATENTEE